ncbi:MAG TPA: 2-phospho-L-lactate transferase [Blastocatellia bacterium]|nr:2-phospho-L-lactate transferase [Blastocatellia bacterium]
MITALAGGVGASKLLDGLNRAMSPEEISIIVNTGDDIEMFGLYIAPDLDIVAYTLAGVVNPDFGWGVNSDTFYCLDMLLRYADQERWFNLGDRDFATHIFRTDRLRKGQTLSQVTEQIAQTLGVKARLLPMTDTHTPTTILTTEGEMHFQEYLVKHRAQPTVNSIRFENIESAKPAPGVAEAILESEAIIICPSNPLISIGPILAVPGTREMLKQTQAKVAVISPVVAGESLKGPTDQMLRNLGMDVSALQIAKLYEDITDIFILDKQDEALKPEIEQLGLKVVVTDTVMSNAAKKLELAETTLAALAD